MGLPVVDFETSVNSTVQNLAESMGDTMPLEPVRKVSLTEKLRRIADSQGFEVEELLGRGGMGAVMLAKDRSLGRMVALKFLAIPAKASEAQLEGLRMEAERAGRLTDENVVQVYSWHSVGQLTFFAMEYVEGENLQQLVQREHKIAPEELLRVIAEASSGVEAAHEKGILHRDIKPQNILISRSRRIKVADFGLSANAMDERLRDGQRISGTLGFMAPEQARGEPCSFSSDVYGLAASLYYAFSKVSPYGSPQRTREMLMKNQSGMIVPLSEVMPDLHPLIHHLVDKGMAANAQNRYQTAKEFRRAIENTLMALHKVETGPRVTLARRIVDWLHWPSIGIGLAAGIGIGIAIGFAMMM